MQVWLVCYEGHDDGVHPEAVFSSEEAARKFMAETKTGVIWECMPLDMMD